MEENPMMTAPRDAAWREELRKATSAKERLFREWKCRILTRLTVSQTMRR